MGVRPATRLYRTWIIDSSRWERYRPRDGDIVIATYPKSGTTWMQQIVGSLLAGSPEPRPVMDICPWIDRRFPHPLDAVMAQIEAQRDRRFLKSHLPADGLPLYDQVHYIHVARDGRDAALSFHSHARGFTQQMLAALDRSGLEDPALGRAYPDIPADPAVCFHRWLSEGPIPGQESGLTMMSWFDCEASWWAERERPNVLLVHYADLQRDLAGEMRRIAIALGIAVHEELWPALVEQAGFAAMRKNGSELMGTVAGIFDRGAERFFHRGGSGHWRGVFREDDLALYRRKLTAALPPDGADWLQHGRLAMLRH